VSNVTKAITRRRASPHWDQFLCLAFAQLTYRESLRDIEACLRAQHSKLYHMGFRGAISRATLAYANEHRDWRLFAAFAQGLIQKARLLYRDEAFAVELQETVYAFDSTTIDLCLTLFPWAQFRRRKSAVKVHTLLDLRGCIPTRVYVTGGQVHDVNLLDELLPEPGAFYLLDRGYLDYERLYVFAQACASSPGPRRILSSTGARGTPWTGAPGCVPTKPFDSLVPKLRISIPIPCDASTISTPRRTCGSSS
jgi:hypothetical protein